MRGANITIVMGELRIAQPEDITSGWAPAWEEDFQEIRLFHAAGRRVQPRGNGLATCTFRVSRGHSSLAAAEAYLDGLCITVRNANRSVNRTFTKFGATGASNLTLHHAALTFRAQPVDGLRTNIEWTVRGTIPPEIL